MIWTTKPSSVETGVPKIAASPGAAPTTRSKELVEAVAPLASVTVAMIAKVPDWVGVPESTPAELKVIPLGTTLAVENVLGVDPPDAERVTGVKVEFTVADRQLEGVVIDSAEAIVNVAAEEVAMAVVPFRLFVTTTV